VSTPTKVGTPDLWRSLINVYGVLENGLSQVRLLQEDELTEIVGTVSYHPTDATQLIFNPDIDTLPANTLEPINAIIDPYKVTVDASITSPAVGTRYLILKAIGSEANTAANDAVAWQGTANQPLIANANDIIEWNGTAWITVWNPADGGVPTYIQNLRTGIQYRWDGEQWLKSFEGEYAPGTWGFRLNNC
jgi:hypothetical protein